MNTYRFYIEGTLESWLDVDELERRLVVEISADDSRGNLSDSTANDDIYVIDYEKCEVAQICPHDNSMLKHRIFNIDGTNLEECAVCLKCGYGTPSLR